MTGRADVLSIWPAAASASAGETDRLILAFTVLTLLLVVPIFVGITLFAVRYRAGRQVNRVHVVDHDRPLELAWMIIPFVLTLIFFAWGAQMFVGHRTPPADATEISAIGRQWMWKFRHPGGQAEINDLHVPTGTNMVIRMISQDVIHSLYIPALRIQMETLPGRYTTLWFRADRPGRYHLFCSEYCGTDHSLMAGWLTVMSPADYASWLASAGTAGTLADEGAVLFAQSGCGGCHAAVATLRAPSLRGMFHATVRLADGSSAWVDEGFLRGAILDPGRHLLAGYAPVMPSYRGVLDEAQLEALVAYLKGQK